MGIKIHTTKEDINGNTLVLFFCPGCNEHHGVRVKGSHPCWTWNESLETPTFSPSILVFAPMKDKKNKTLCHSFVNNGKIKFLSDSAHKLAGKEVDIPDFDDTFDVIQLQ